MAETAVLGVGRNEIPPYYTELSKSTVQVLLTSAEKRRLDFFEQAKKRRRD